MGGIFALTNFPYLITQGVAFPYLECPVPVSPTATNGMPEILVHCVEDLSITKASVLQFLAAVERLGEGFEPVILVEGEFEELIEGLDEVAPEITFYLPSEPENALGRHEYVDVTVKGNHREYEALQAIRYGWSNSGLSRSTTA